MKTTIFSVIFLLCIMASAHGQLQEGDNLLGGSVGFWAKGSVPTPHGAVVVAWKLSPRELKLDVTVPVGAEADVVVPVSRFERPVVTLGGKIAERRAHVTAGVHHFQVVGESMLP